MYKWRVEVLLNNGKSYLGFIKCDLKDYKEVAKYLLDIKDPNVFVNISTKLLNGKEAQTLIRYRDISAITISVPDEQD